MEWTALGAVEGKSAGKSTREGFISHQSLNVCTCAHLKKKKKKRAFRTCNTMKCKDVFTNAVHTLCIMAIHELMKFILILYHFIQMIA